MSSKRIVGFISVAILVASYGISHWTISKMRSDQPAEAKRAQAIPIDPQLLRIVSGPFKGLVADYLILKASVFMGGTWNVTNEDWEAVYILLKQSLYLDPLFFQTGYYVQGLLSWRKDYYQKAIDLIEIQAKHRNWDWEPKFYIGFNYFHHLKNYDKAARYLQEAAKLSGAPPIATTLASRLVQKSGHTVTAIAFLRTMLERAQDKYTQELLSHRLAYLLGLYKLEQAQDLFTSRFGQPAHSIRELFDGGFVDQFSSELNIGAYSLDDATGKITLN